MPPGRRASGQPQCPGRNSHLLATLSPTLRSQWERAFAGAGVLQRWPSGTSVCLATTRPILICRRPEHANRYNFSPVVCSWQREPVRLRLQLRLWLWLWLWLLAAGCGHGCCCGCGCLLWFWQLWPWLWLRWWLWLWLSLSLPLSLHGVIPRKPHVLTGGHGGGGLMAVTQHK